MAELKLLRMDSILARSTLSRVDSESDTEVAGGVTGCFAAVGGSVFVGARVETVAAEVDTAGVDATGWLVSLLCSSNGESHST